MNSLLDAMTFHTAKKIIKGLDSAFCPLSDTGLFSSFFHQPLCLCCIVISAQQAPFKIRNVSFPLKYFVSKFPYERDSSWEC